MSNQQIFVLMVCSMKFNRNNSTQIMQDDSLLGGSIVIIFAKNIMYFFDEFVERGIVNKTKFVGNTP